MTCSSYSLWMFFLRDCGVAVLRKVGRWLPPLPFRTRPSIYNLSPSIYSFYMERTAETFNRHNTCGRAAPFFILFADSPMLPPGSPSTNDHFAFWLVPCLMDRSSFACLLFLFSFYYSISFTRLSAVLPHAGGAKFLREIDVYAHANSYTVDVGIFIRSIGDSLWRGWLHGFYVNLKEMFFTYSPKIATFFQYVFPIEAAATIHQRC